MELSDKDIKRMLIEYYNTFNRLDELAKEITGWEKELDSMVESLMLSAQRISDMPKPKYNNTSSVERIYESTEEIRLVYEERLERTRNELREVVRKQELLHKWIKEAELTDIEEKIIRYMYKDGLQDWKIGDKVGYNRRSIWKVRKKIFEKLKKGIKGQ